MIEKTKPVTVFKFKMKHWLTLHNMNSKQFCAKYGFNETTLVKWLAGDNVPGEKYI